MKNEPDSIDSEPNPPYRDPVDVNDGPPPPPPDPSFPTPVYLLRFNLAFLLSVLTLSKSPNNSASSLERFRTVEQTQ